MFFFFFKQKTAYEMRISDWSSDVCSSDLAEGLSFHRFCVEPAGRGLDAAVARRAIRALARRAGAFRSGDIGCGSADAAGEPELAWRWRRRGRADADRPGGSVASVAAASAGGGATSDARRVGKECGSSDWISDRGSADL